jgi:hypothetical protein
MRRSGRVHKLVTSNPKADRLRTLTARREAAARAEEADMARAMARTKARHQARASKMQRRGPGYEDKSRSLATGEDLLQGISFSNHIAEDLAREQGLNRFDFSDHRPSGKRGFTKPDVEEILAGLITDDD